jgi:hypothetical protein
MQLFPRTRARRFWTHVLGWGLLAAIAIASFANAASAAPDLSHRRLADSEAVRSTLEEFGSYLTAAETLTLDPSRIQKFLTDRVAVVSGRKGSSLIESSIPLRTLNQDGKLRPVDFDLERSKGVLQPGNPLVPLGLPLRLGDGLSLPSLGVTVDLTNANPEVAPTVVGQSAAIYPNAERDSTLAVIPLPRGFETLTVLHSPLASRTQEFDLRLPEGVTLESTPGGGAEIELGGRVLASVAPPSSVDANGAPVETKLEVRGLTLRVEVSPKFSNSYPILVDPVYQTYSWSSGTSSGLSDWSKTSNTSVYTAATQLNCGTNCVSPYEKSGAAGLYAGATSGAVSAGATAYWSYFVPRYQADKTKYGQLPTSFITKAELSSIMFFHRADAAASPALFAGLWSSPEAPYWGGPNYWASQVIRYGNQPDWTAGAINLENPSNNQATKWLLAGLAATDSHSVTAYRDAYFGAAKITLSDSGKPVLSGIVPPSGWYDQSAPTPVPMTAEDTGLGVASFTSKETVAPFTSWEYSLNCPGTVSSPCPRVWNSSEGRPELLTWPTALPEGISKIALTATDPVGNVSETSYVEVKVDHSAPIVTLAGNLVEPGAKRLDPGKYPLTISATDGTPVTKPRSGVKSIAIEVDGKVVPGTLEQSCPAGSCSATRNWTFDVTSYSNGDHVVKVLVKDQVGRQATTELKVTVDKGQIYWGSWIDGDVALMPREGEKPPRGDAPWDSAAWDLFESHAGKKKVSIIHFGQPPPWVEPKFQEGPLNLTINRGAIPMMDMRNDASNLPVHISLQDIVDGKGDAAFKKWAEEVAAFKKPFFFRWDWEMNGTWNAWGSEAASNPEVFVEAWKHLHDIAEGAGATNMTWVWCPNIKGPTTKPMKPLFPEGSKYVDWTCLDGYNWGTSPVQSDSWKSFKEVFSPSYAEIQEFAPGKPVMIGETASTEFGGSKSSWISDALAQIPVSFPMVKAFVWFNWNAEEGSGRMDWPIESSKTAEEAFAAGIGSSNYAAGGPAFESLPALSPIQPLP